MPADSSELHTMNTRELVTVFDTIGRARSAMEGIADNPSCTCAVRTVLYVEIERLSTKRHQFGVELKNRTAETDPDDSMEVLRALLEVGMIPEWATESIAFHSAR